MTSNGRKEVPTTTEYTDVQEKLKKECEDLWLKVRQLQQEVKEMRQPVKTEQSEGEDVALLIGNHKVKSLKAHLTTLRQYEPEGLPVEKPALHEFLLSDLKKSSHELQQTVTVVRSQNEDSRQAMERERKWLQEQKEIQTALEKKIRDRGEVLGRHVSKHSVLKQVEKERRDTEKYNEKRMKELKDFIQENIPEPSEEEVQKWAKKRGNQNLIPVPKITMLEELLNKTLSTPHDPYISVTESHWKPFVEFLLRFNIAQKHPTDGSQIRVMPFHL